MPYFGPWQGPGEAQACVVRRSTEIADFISDNPETKKSPKLLEARQRKCRQDLVLSEVLARPGWNSPFGGQSDRNFGRVFR